MEHGKAVHTVMQRQENSYQQRQVKIILKQSDFHGLSTIMRGLPSGCQHYRSNIQIPTPASHTELHSFYGLVNRLTSGTNIIAELMSPLRSLLSTKNEIIWSADHALFCKVKEQLVTYVTGVGIP